MEWHAGDLVTTPDGKGEWAVLSALDAALFNTVGPAAATLLASSTAPLWDALRGLPNTAQKVDGSLWIALAGLPGDGYSGM